MSLLEIDNLVTGYGKVPVIHGIDIRVEQGELVAVIGANGAGKSTMLRTISGIGRPFSGDIRFDGTSLVKASPAHIVSSGIAHVPENRRVFAAHSVTDNLRIGAYGRRRDRAGIAEDIARLEEQFPILGERREQLAGSLSGGQQQMLAIAMAMMARPRLLMLDEPSLGLAPIIVERLFEEIVRLRNEGTTVLLVEQLAQAALAVADRGFVLQLGEIIAQGSADQLRSDDAVRVAYLGG
jgi:branched-chain amino acid transport system ATP-binding protein